LRGVGDVTQAPSVISGELSPISLPSPLLIVAQHWPSAFVVASSLGLPVCQLFVNPRFKTLASSICHDLCIQIFDVDQIHQAVLPVRAVCMVSGSVDFFTKVRVWLQDYSEVIWSFEQSF
jgi:hypothetical protein